MFRRTGPTVAVAILASALFISLALSVASATAAQAKRTTTNPKTTAPSAPSTGSSSKKDPQEKKEALFDDQAIPLTHDQILENLQVEKRKAADKLEREIAKLKDQIKFGSQSKGPTELRTELKQLERDLAAIKTDKVRPMPELQLTAPRVGRFGRLKMTGTTRWLRVVEVKDEDSFVAEIGIRGSSGKAGTTFGAVSPFLLLVDNVETLNLKAGSTTQLDGTFWFSDWDRLEPTEDGKPGKPLFTLTPFDPDAFVNGAQAPAKKASAGS